jgi:hypothetical protein
MARTGSHIDVSGPFFQRDPRKTFRANVRVMMRRIEEEGEADVIQQQHVGEGSRAEISHGLGRVSQHVVGRVTSVTGRPWQVTAVVSVNNSGFSGAEGIALMAAASRVEAETHAFRRTTTRLRKARAINAAELLKGIA